MMEWKLWSVVRPTKDWVYRWRIPPRDYGGLILQPEWNSKMILSGMGFGKNELWPSFSQWDGHNRTVPPGTEWRMADESEPQESWPGLILKPCPFCGDDPKFEWEERYMHAPIFHYKSFKIRCECMFAESVSNHCLEWLVDKWNTRKRPQNKRLSCTSAP